MTGQSRPVNQRTFKWVNGLGGFQPRELHQHLLHGSQLDRSTFRQEFEQLHQAWPWSGLARFGPTHRRVPQPGRASNQQGAPPSWLVSDRQGRRWSTRREVPRSIETRNQVHACMAHRWNKTKKKTLLRIRLGRDQGRSRCLVALTNRWKLALISVLPHF